MDPSIDLPPRDTSIDPSTESISIDILSIDILSIDGSIDVSIDVSIDILPSIDGRQQAFLARARKRFRV